MASQNERDLCVEDASQVVSDAEMRWEMSLQIQATDRISREHNTGLVEAQIWELWTLQSVSAVAEPVTVATDAMSAKKWQI